MPPSGFREKRERSIVAVHFVVWTPTPGDPFCVTRRKTSPPPEHVNASAVASFNVRPTMSTAAFWTVTAEPVRVVPVPIKSTGLSIVKAGSV